MATRLHSQTSPSIPSGTIYGYIGPNGAGKTTMRILATLSEPTSGSAAVHGIPVTNRTEVMQHIGYLPESSPLYYNLTAIEQLQLAAELRDLPDSKATDRIESLLERFGLYEDATTRIADFSKGMRQKTAFLQVILHEPSVVFLDEPTAGLDPRVARTLRDMIVELAAEGTTVLLSTHILPVVEELADTVGVLFDGRLVAEGTPSELADRAGTDGCQTLEAAFHNLTTNESLPEEVDENA